MLLIQVHGSHIVAGLSVLALVLTAAHLDPDFPFLLLAGLLYWHLIDIVWLTLLSFVFYV